MARKVTVIPAKQAGSKTGKKATEVRKTRVAAYCRVSTDEDEQLNSFELTVPFCPISIFQIHLPNWAFIGFMTFEIGRAHV